MFKRDCYYYTEVQDMSAHIPTCCRQDNLGVCPCENCDEYLTNKEASVRVNKYPLVVHLLRKVMEDFKNMQYTNSLCEMCAAQCKEEDITHCGCYHWKYFEEVEKLIGE